MLPAIASSETSPSVEAVNTKSGSGGYEYESHSWQPSQVAVMAGGAVTFSNPSAIRHGIHWISAPSTPTCSAGVPVGTDETAAGTKWSGTCTFSAPGTYTYYCTVHGPEMTGTVTVSASGATTVTPPGTTTTTTTTPKPAPVATLASLPASQRGGSVKGSLKVSPSAAGDELEVDLIASSASLAGARHTAHVRIGRLVRGSVRAGTVSFVVKLDARARAALRRRRRLPLTVKIVLTPVYGEPTVITRSVVEHR